MHPSQLGTARLLKTNPSFWLYIHIHASRGDIHAKHIVHTTNGRPISSRWDKYCSRTIPYDRTVQERRWLCTRSLVDRILGLMHDSARDPTQDLCSAMASRWVRQLSLTLWDMLTTVKFEFRVAAYLDGALATYFNKRWGGVSVDDNAGSTNV